ncbi:5-bromo-4-chloroindolyl phosphate hydrolysis family protein [Aliiroseovarius sp. S1339]|uniref:5-bromo-4-chloroindolyl phosphate hydrolysis family protein n=1 Tax=Aliiroseovarius sp. S1339 TaxID=2936990 RepID=UPI0020BE6D64|nr:5-bromo-4-chloroindolyl phosphate hydrolysis family protein [Aliiroseovarius sp. S1339]MCK8464179.1 5-bromo-4-chloroindolyl phosphate hydrolysis family protein [Aliiroseovarius sp. S1339]
MTQRYGGEFSPKGTDKNAGPAGRSPYHGKTRSRAGGRVNLLFIAPLPLAFLAFFRDPGDLILRLLAFGALIAAAWLTREGVLAHEEYDARKIARRPAIPRKLFGAALTGVGLFLAGSVDGTPIIAAALGLLGFGLHLFAFGLDPMRHKGLDDIDEFQTDRVARAVTEAEKHLRAMKEAIERTKDRRLEARLERFISTARDMFRTVEDDPRDLTAARKYLGVYLLGARDATTKFVDIYMRDPGGGARADYETLLDDLEANFTARTQQFLNDNRTGLDVEIEVLRERLAREGVRSE